MDLSIDDVIEILKIVRECKDAELHIETGDLKLSIFKGKIGESPRGLANFSGASRSAQIEPEETAAVSAPEKEEETAALESPAETGRTKKDSDEGLMPIKATITSVFYRCPSPEEPPFVEVGDMVQEDTVVCLLEVMKCFRQVTADVRGRIEKICAEDSELVEAGTVMFLIRPE